MRKFRKQPNDHLDYDIVFTDWLSDGDIVTGATFSITPNTLQLTGTEISSTFVKIWLNNGVDGVDYKITGNITTQLGREKEVELGIKVRDL